MKTETTGLSVNYYLVEIKEPNQAQAPYVAECSDIIEALGMDFNEGELFKSLWRRAAQRTLLKGKEGNSAIRDAEKIIHFAGRIYKLTPKVHK